MAAGNLDIPEEKVKLPNSNIKTSYYFVGDAAFEISKNMIRPYPGQELPDDKRIFNYRLSRARRCIENTFGILRARWKVTGKTMPFAPEQVITIVTATVYLHNFIMARTMKEVRQMYCPNNFVDRIN